MASETDYTAPKGSPLLLQIITLTIPRAQGGHHRNSQNNGGEKVRLNEKPDMQILFKGIEIKLNFDKSNPEEVVNFFSKLKQGVEYDIDAKERARRSLNANAYHWLLVGKIAEANGISKYEVHNRLLADYGTDWIDANGDRSYVLMKDDDRYLRSDAIHYRPTDATEDRKGTIYRWFILLLPSRLMNKKQMSNLIDGTVQEAQAVGIDTRTPQEIEQLLTKWEAKHEQLDI